MSQISEIWRHPLKSLGRERLDGVTLAPRETMPWDRTWAVLHEAAEADGSVWAHCANFLRVTKAPALAQVVSALDEANRTLTLSHPDRPDLTFQPDSSPAEFFEWVAPLLPANRALPTRIVTVPGRGMTDNDDPAVSLLNQASLDAVATRVGQSLDRARFRGNFWVTGLAPWAELDWVGKTIRIGEVEAFVTEPNERCLATHANPATGTRDADVLGALESGWSTRDFGLYAIVTKGGRVALGDQVALV